MRRKADTPRACRNCGCTDDDCSQCIARTGEPCHWVETDLCSACSPSPAVILDRIVRNVPGYDAVLQKLQLTGSVCYRTTVEDGVARFDVIDTAGRTDMPRSVA